MRTALFTGTLKVSCISCLWTQSAATFFSHANTSKCGRVKESKIDELGRNYLWHFFLWEIGSYALLWLCQVPTSSWRPMATWNWETLGALLSSRVTPPCLESSTIWLAPQVSHTFSHPSIPREFHSGGHHRLIRPLVTPTYPESFTVWWVPPIGHTFSHSSIPREFHSLVGTTK